LTRAQRKIFRGEETLEETCTPWKEDSKRARKKRQKCTRGASPEKEKIKGGREGGRLGGLKLILGIPKKLKRTKQ